jgi:diguanylate cyclase (GGDEF)-like protein/PAS domain S-box-containing protein
MLRCRLPFSLAGAAALTLGAGLTVTATLFVAVSHLEYDKMTLSFQQRAHLRVTAIRQGLDAALEVLTVTNDLFNTVSPVTRAQFHAFTEPLLARNPFIQAFNFHRIVSQAERPAYESALRAQFPGFAIRQFSDGKLVPAASSARYNIVDYIEPLRGNEAAFGLDVAPNVQAAAAMELALASGRASATGLLRLAQNKASERGFVVLMPVYRAGAPRASALERRAALIGDTAAVFNATTLVQAILRGSGFPDEQELVLRVYASALADQASLVYQNGPALPAARPGLPGWLATGNQQQYAQSFMMAGKPWHLQVSAEPRPFLSAHLGSLSSLLGGILFSLLSAALVHTLVQRSRRVQLQVDARTADLQLSNQRLIDDVRARKQAELALQESEQRFRQLVTLSTDWYWEQDAQFRYTSIAGGIDGKSGVPVAHMLGKTRWENYPELLSSTWGRAHIAQLEAHQPFWNLEYQVVSNGETLWFSVNGEPLFDTAGNFKGYRGTSADITARKLAEQRIHHIAHHDVLTGLPNRVLLQDRLNQAIAHASRSGRPIWVLLIDLDRFKFVNDSMGHKAGDLLLQTVAARLLAALRDSDTVARLAGDEFVAILSEHPEGQLRADILWRLMETVGQAIVLEGKEIFVTCSIGVAVFPTDGAPGHKLIEQADIAMYRAKKLGRNNFQFYTPVMNEEALERVRIESALRNALERDEFVLHYQAQVDLASGAITGMEALIRWQHPELGMVAPDRFIGMAEETGLIVPIGAWVMRTACAQNKAWQDAGLGMLRISVTLSAPQFGAPTLIASIAAVLAQTGLPPASLEIELTESLFMSDVDLAVDLLHGMKALGVTLSIDDFGTGYSSLSYLRRFPIDVLKIDRSFVNDIASNADDCAIVVSIIALAHNLKLRVIAEGVETAGQLDFLRTHGCDEMQGYYFSRPVPAPQFEQLLREGKSLARRELLAASAAA